MLIGVLIMIPPVTVSVIGLARWLWTRWRLPRVDPLAYAYLVLDRSPAARAVQLRRRARTGALIGSTLWGAAGGNLYAAIERLPIVGGQWILVGCAAAIGTFALAYASRCRAEARAMAALDHQAREASAAMGIRSVWRRPDGPTSTTPRPAPTAIASSGDRTSQ